MKVTAQEVARTASVSVGTVSRVLNGDTSVNPEFAARVRRASQELNYRPLRLRRGHATPVASPAQPLAGKVVALVTLGMDRSLATLPVVAMALQGAEAAIREAGGSMLFVDAPDLRAAPSVLGQHPVAGVILKGPMQGRADWSGHTPLLDRLRGLPTVWMLGRPVGAWGDAVNANDCDVGRMAAEHLLVAGHRRLAFLNPKADHSQFVRRQVSFTHVARAGGAEVQSFLGRPGAWPLPLHALTDVGAVQALADALVAADPRPTAVFTPADSIAALVYHSLSSRGMAVGRDISILSVNNERPIHHGLFPSLTTIDIHAEQIGRRAVDQLAWRLGRPNDRPAEIALEPTLVEGRSVQAV